MSDQPVQCPNRGCCAHQPSAFPSGTSVLLVVGCCKTSGDVVWWGLVRCRVMLWRDEWSNRMWCGDKCWDATTVLQVLQNRTQHYKLLLCTTKYYSVVQTITQYYKESTTKQYVLQRKYYKVRHSLQSTTKYLICTTKYYSVPQDTAKYYKVQLRDAWNIQYIRQSNLWQVYITKCCTCR